MTPEEMEHYNAALDEIFLLRQALAYEAGVTSAHLEYKTFPKSRRDVAHAQIERMRQSARGLVQAAYADRSRWSLRRSFKESGASETLTRYQWETERRGATR